MKPEKSKTLTSQVAVQVLAVILAALGLFWLSRLEFLSSHPTAVNFLQSIAGFLVSSVALAVFWELLNRRAFAEEILGHVRLSQNIRDAGVTEIGPGFVDIQFWPEWIEKSQEVDLLFSYASNWRNSHIHRIKDRCSVRPMKITVIVPDVRQSQVMDELAARYSKSTRERIAEQIDDAVNEFSALSGINGTTVQVYRLPRAPLFSYYRFDSSAVVSVYDHSKEKVPVPFFAFFSGGYSFRFFKDEFDRLRHMSEKVEFQSAV